jgi:hypothetical protein
VLQRKLLENLIENILNEYANIVELFDAFTIKIFIFTIAAKFRQGCQIFIGTTYQNGKMTK